MIELRWLILGAHELSQHPAAIRDEAQQGSRFRVLQVRYENLDTGVFFPNREHRMTPWQDVPIAEEP